MKKIIIAILSLFMAMSFATFAVATAITTTAGGAAVAITNAGGPGGGPTLSFTPSPSTVMSTFTSPTQFTITAASKKTTTANGIEYGIDSDTSVIYQKVQAADGAVTATTSAATLPTPSVFKDKAGNDAS